MYKLYSLCLHLSLSLFFLGLFLPGEAQPFITTWQTDNTGSSCNSCITIGAGPTDNFDVDWDNDGVFDEFGLSGTFTHDFGVPGTYTIQIQGNLASPPVQGDPQKIISIDQWGDIVWTNMAYTFANCTNVTENAPDAPDLSQITDLQQMFNGATSFDGDIDNWDVSTVTNMQSMFQFATFFNQDLNSWDVSNVTDFSFMFLNATDFNGDISNWDVSSGQTFYGMFSQTSAFNSDISGWVTTSSTEFGEMFHNAPAFDQDLGGWDISNVTNMGAMLDNSGLSIANYDATLIGWESQGVFFYSPGVGGLEYCNGEAARTSLINNYNWSFFGDVLNCPPVPDPFITTWQTDNPGTSCNSCITIPTFPGETYSYDVDWDNDGVFDEFGLTGNVTHDFGVAGTYTIQIQGTFPRINFGLSLIDNEKIISIDQWGDIAWTNMDNAFATCSNLTYNTTDAPNLSGVTNLSAMFNACTSFNGNLNNWDVSTITNMSGMFAVATVFNGDISSWDVSNVTNMASMFSFTDAFNGDLSGWDVSAVTNMALLFFETTSFNADISGWQTGNVEIMLSAFEDAAAFDQDLGNWDLSGLTLPDFNLDDSGMSTSNYDNTLIGWANQGLFGITLNATGLEYCLGADARQNLVNNLFWTIFGDTENCVPCGAGGLTFSTQQEVDDFPALYPACTEILGDVTISGADITDLSPLSQITSIGGELSISFCPVLTSLNGLNNVGSLGSHLLIGFNDLLANVSALSMLTNISGGDLIIASNGALTSLSGLDNIDHTSIGTLTIQDNGLLSVCDVMSVCSYLANGWPATITNNAPGCATEAEVDAACPDAIFTILADDIIDDCGTGVISVPITVQDFTDVIAYQFSFHWDPTVLDFGQIVPSGAIPINIATDFGLANVNTGVLSHVWFDQNFTGVTLADNTVLFTIEYNYVPGGSTTSALAFSGTPIFIEAANANNEGGTIIIMDGSYTLLDADGDGIGDVCDTCPNDPDNDIDGDGICGDIDNCPDVANDNQADSDGDGVGNKCDNCRPIPNADQLDSDGDGEGDVCDICPNDPDNDIDGDGVCGDVDNCPDVANSNQADSDSDGIGNKCDNCRTVANTDQQDSDGDGVGDACDTCPLDDPDDDDGDGVCTSVDNCPDTPNPNQADADADGVGNKCDNCRTLANSDQQDSDGDGIGDVCDICPNDPFDDVDGDAVCGDVDNCPDIANGNQGDRDGDGVGNACDNCPETPNPDQTDTDNDGIGDACDTGLAPEQIDLRQPAATIRIFPNPADGNLNIDLSSLLGQVVTISLYDALGRESYRLELAEVQQSILDIDYRSQRMAPGWYSVVIRTGAKVVTLKVLLL